MYILSNVLDLEKYEVHIDGKVIILYVWRGI